MADYNLQDLVASNQCMIVDQQLADRYGWTVPVAIHEQLVDQPQLVNQLVIEGAEAARSAGDQPYTKLTLDGKDFWLHSMEGDDKIPYVLIYNA
jgi:hypothetical protein